MKSTPFETYVMYLALKSHFSSKYDYFKYQGQMRATEAQFEKRNDRYFFQKLAKQYQGDELRDYMVANIIEGRKWIGDFLSEQGQATYNSYVRRKQSITKTVLDEVQSALEEVSQPRDLFHSEEAEYPPILCKKLDGTVGYESLIVLDDFVSYINKFDEKYGSEDIVWGPIRFTIQKLRPFIEYDRTRMKNGLSKLLLN